MDTVEAKKSLRNTQENQNLFLHEDMCDKYDYLAAAGCGAIGGIIDIFLVGAPGESVLENWTDTQANNVVMAFARKMGWDPKASQKSNVKSAIGFLEYNSQKNSVFKGFRVNYDQASTKATGGQVELWTKNHHMKSLAHSPDVIGLFFSVLNQFTSTASFVDRGKLITIRTDTFELQGENLVSRLFCGVANWFGHLMSDMAGSSGAAGRGTGIVMPFYELLGFCKLGKFRVENDLQDLATIATRVFQEGYDLRFGAAAAIPVLITDLSIRLIWALRRHFQYEVPIKECVPTAKHETLRIMLLVGNGTLCVIDVADAGIRSGGNFLIFFMHLNIPAWYRFVTLVLKEVFIRVGIADPLQKTIDAFVRVNEALQQYLHELEKVDIEKFEQETKLYMAAIADFDSIKSNEELNRLLLQKYEILGINKPWEGEFNEHMANKNAHLSFG